MKHSQLKLIDYSEENRFAIIGIDENTCINEVCDADGFTEMLPRELAATIVHRWNAFEPMREALEDVLSRLPNEKIIEDLKADKGLGYRKYALDRSPSDKEIVQWRAALALAGKESDHD